MQYVQKNVGEEQKITYTVHVIKAILSRTPPFIYSDLELPVAVAAAAVELPIEKFGTYFFV